MPQLLFFLGLIGLVITLIALIRGRLDWARIKTRKAAAAGSAVAFAVLVGGVAWGAATTPVPNSPNPPSATSSSAPAPMTITTTTAAPTTTTTTNPPPPPPVTTTNQPVTTAAPPPAPARNCTASVSDSTPADNSTVDVFVQTGIPGASVTATAYYKTTSTSRSASANGSGTATIAFRISRATPGYIVDVEVTVSAGNDSQSCSTSFTPQ